jgi:hypothetical protein
MHDKMDGISIAISIAPISITLPAKSGAAAFWAAAPVLPHAVRMSWFFSGNVRMRLPVAAK